MFSFSLEEEVSIKDLYFAGYNPEDIAEELNLDETEVIDYCANLLDDDI